MVQVKNVNEKSNSKENKAELFSFFGKMLLLFPTCGILIFSFFQYWFGHTSPSFSWLMWSIGILWVAILVGGKTLKLIDKRISPKLVDRTVAFIRSGEPKGFNFEVLMSYISNLTINGLVMALALQVYKEWGMVFAMVIWLLAMFIMLITIFNFLYNAEFDPEKRPAVILFAGLSLFSFLIPLILAN